MIKPIFYTISVLALGWGFLTQSGGLLLKTYKVTFGSCFWAYSLIIFYDMFHTWRGKNTDFLKKFYSDIFFELFMAFIVSVTLSIIFFYDSEKYSFSNIDIAATGFPFILLSIIKLSKIIKTKITEVEKSNLPFMVVLAVTSAGYIFTVYLSIKVSSNSYGTFGSLWIQISILCASLYTYVESSRMYYFISNRHIEVSAPILDLFKNKIISGYNIYEDASKGAAIWNKEMSKQKKKKKNA